MAVCQHQDAAVTSMLQYWLSLRWLVLGQPVQAGGYIDCIKKVALVARYLQNGRAGRGCGYLLVDVCWVRRAMLPWWPGLLEAPLPVGSKILRRTGRCGMVHSRVAMRLILACRWRPVWWWTVRLPSLQAVTYSETTAQEY